MNSALTSRESGAWLFHITLDGRRNGVAKEWPAEITRGEHAREDRKKRGDEGGGGRGGEKGEKSAWIRAESDIKYIRIFSRDSPRAATVGPNPGFRFDEFSRSAYFSILTLPENPQFNRSH